MLVKPHPSDHVKTSPADTHGADGFERQRRPFRQLFAVQKRSLARPVHWLGHPFLLITEACGPLRRGDDRAIAGDQLEKVKALTVGQLARSSHVGRIVRLGTVELHCHLHHEIGAGDGCDTSRDFFALTFEFALELGDQRRRPLAIEPLKSVAHGSGNGRGHHGHGEGHREGKGQ